MRRKTLIGVEIRLYFCSIVEKEQLLDNVENCNQSSKMTSKDTDSSKNTLTMRA
tara:strand:- start:528 stop:689 length:162 start_codon:yes stop_codon:yes gene_type:complete